MATTLKLDIIIESIKAGRKITGYHARFNGLEGTGRTKAEAVAALKTQLDLRTEWRRSHVKIEKLHGYIGVFYYGLQGNVETRQISPDHGDGPIYSSSIGPGTVEDARRDFRFHIAQLTWDGTSLHSNDVPEGRQGDFKAWAQWQLAYKAFKAKGVSDVEAHALATANWRNYEAQAS